MFNYSPVKSTILIEIDHYIEL